MRIVPAVDIRGGLCVNLVQGDYAQETVCSEDPVAQAEAWHRQGGALIHVVDLDGAKEGRLCVGPQLQALTDRGIPFEIGGGIRNLSTIRAAFRAGAERVILGTAAHANPTLVEEAATEFPGRVVVGIDAKDGKVAVKGWLEVTDADAVVFAEQMASLGAGRIIYTDILSDGMMRGPNLSATQRLAQTVSIPVTLSGGMSSLDDVRNACSLETDGVDEVIVGRALYVGAFSLQEALELVEEGR